MKRILSMIFVLAMFAALVASAIPASAAYDLDYFRYPIEAVYEALGEAGYAKGMLTVKVNNWVSSSDCPTDAVAFWANEDGPLEGYSHLARFKLSTRSTTYEFPELQIIPEGADRLLVYTSIHGTDQLSTQSVEAMLPENYDYIPASLPILSFVVLSDTHLTSDDNARANLRFKDMLEDVKTDFSDVSGIFINGDNINSTQDASNSALAPIQFAKIEAYRSQINPDVPIFMGVGNHDMWPNAKQDEVKNDFLAAATLPDGSNPKSLNYELWLGGYHFIFIGDDDRDPNYVTLNKNTLKWLDETIADGYEEGSPTFIFMHQAVSNTVAGSLTNLGQEWDGVVNAVEVRSVLRKYPRAILFSGHSHYSMDSVQNAYSGGELFPTTFNTASLANVGAASDGTDNDEAQGYVIEVHEDSVYVRGYDFAHDEWKASAQYIVDYGAEQGERPVIPENKPNENNNTNNGVNNESNNNKATEKSTDKATNKPTDASESGATEQAEGCGAAVSIGAVSIATVSAITALCCSPRTKKKKNN